MSTEVRDWFHSFIEAPGFSTQYRYYTAVLGKLDPFPDPTVRVMAVSAHLGRFCLHINTDYFVEHPEYLSGVLLHEVHHVVLGHLSHPKLHGAAHPDLMELAMEISANEHIKEMLPPGAITWQSFRDAGICQNQSTLQRYELLVGARRDGLLVSAGDVNWVDDHGPNGGQGVRQAGNESSARPSPDDLESLSKVIEEITTGSSEDGGRLAGREPGQIFEELHGTEEPPMKDIDWRAALRMLVAQIRSPVHTYSRPNRRFVSRVGEVPGRTWTPGSRERPRVLVAIDTSASMSTEELSEVARQLTMLSQVVQITIAECDTEIRRVYPFRGAIACVLGRGGTDLRPVFDTQFLRFHRPDGLVYFTDGCGPLPERAPLVETLWVLTDEDSELACDWGRRVSMGASCPGPGNGLMLQRQLLREGPVQSKPGQLLLQSPRRPRKRLLDCATGSALSAGHETQRPWDLPRRHPRDELVWESEAHSRDLPEGNEKAKLTRSCTSNHLIRQGNLDLPGATHG